MRQVRIDADPVRVRLQLAQQPAPHIDERRRPAGRHVQAPEHFLARRFHRALQRDQVARRGVARIGRGGARDRRGRRREFGCKQVDERLERVRGQRVIGGERFAREGRARHFAALRQQRVAQGDRFARVALGRARVARSLARRGAAVS